MRSPGSQAQRMRDEVGSFTDLALSAPENILVGPLLFKVRETHIDTGYLKVAAEWFY